MPLTQCWEFFSDPRNLKKITPPSLRFRVKTELPPRIYAGLMIQYTVSPILGLPLDWLSEIVQVDEPYYFADEQRIGPYRLWHHEHRFRELSDRHVEVHDLVYYAPPLGPLGGIINALVIRRQVGKIFDFRARKLEEMAES